MPTIDWQSGTIDLESDADSGTPWSVVFASDWAPLEERANFIVVGKQFETAVSDPVRFYGDLAGVLHDADLAVVNLECVLGEAGEPIVKDGPHLRLPARASDPLKDTSKVEAFWGTYADSWLEHGLVQDLTAISPLLLEESDLRDAWLSTLSKRRDIWAKLFRRGIRSLGGLAAKMANDPSGHQGA